MGVVVRVLRGAGGVNVAYGVSRKRFSADGERIKICALSSVKGL